eukprot:188741-Alexandrium_andersonii.AAC.1
MAQVSTLKPPHGVLYGAVGLRLVRGRRLEHSLRAQALCDGPAQVHQRGLIIGLKQDPTAKPEPADAGHRLAH